MNRVYKVIWSKVKNCYVVASELAKSHTKSPKSEVMSRALVAGVLACVLSCGAVMPAYAAYYDTIDYSQSNTYTADTFTNHAFNEVGNGTDLSINGNISSNGFSSSAPSAGYQTASNSHSNSHLNQSYLVNSLGFNTGKFVVTKASTNVKTTTTNGYTVPEYRFKDLNTAIRILSVSGNPIGENSSHGTIFRANPADYISIQQYNGKYYVIGMVSGVGGTSNKRALGYARDIDGKAIQSVFIVQLVQKDGYIETDTRYVNCGGPVALKPIETLVTAFNNASVTRTYASVGEELSIFGKYSPDISVTDNSSLNLTGSAVLADGNLTVSNNSLASVSSDLSASKVSLSGGSTVTSGGTLSAKSIVDSGTGTNILSAASIQTTEGDVNTPNTDVTATDAVESAGVVKLKSLNAPRLLGAGSGMSTLGGGLTVAGQVKGVADATENTDAVNLGQLNAALANVNPSANGTVTNGNTDAVSGGTLFTESRITTDGTFAKVANTTAQNITALDTATGNAISGLSVDGTTITYTKGDGTTGTITTQDNNTTYDIMTASELTTGTSTDARTVSAKVISDYVNERIGASTVSDGSSGSTAVGDGSEVTGDNSVSVGDNSSVTGGGSVSVGTGSSVEGDSNVSIGNNGSVTGSNSVAVGSGASTNESDTVAVGGGSSATGEGAISVGAGTSASGDNSTALGNNSFSTSDNSVALGSNAVASASDVVSVGHNAGDTDAEGNVYTTNEYRRIINVANGVNANDAATVGQMNTAINTETSARTAADTALGARIDGTIKGLSVNGRTITYTKGDGTTGTITTQDTTYSAGSGLSLSNGAFSVVTDGQVAQGNTGIVTGNTVYEALESRIGQITVENNAQNTVAVGDNSSVSGDGAVAVGSGSSGSGEGSVAVGDTSSSSGGGSVAVGSNTTAESDNTVAIGTGSTVSGTDSDNSVAIGQQTNVTGSDSVAVGGGSSVTGTDSTALGGNTVVNNDNSVALGSGSNASQDNVVSVGHSATDTDATGTAYGSDLTRRIVNVADGVDAHDVVTVGQMNQQLATINNYNTTLDARIGTLASDGNYIRSSATNDVAANLMALDTQLKATDVSSLKYDGADHSLVTMGGTSGTKLTNLKQGTLSATSTDAVTGAQLYAVKQDITGFAGDINRNKASIRDLNASISTALESVSSTGELVSTMDDLKADASLNNLTAAGQQVITNAAVNAVQEYMASQGNNGLNASSPKLMGNPRLMAVNPAPANTNYVVYDDTTANTLTLEGVVGTGTRVTNVAEGELSAASMDAVNGSQLYAVTQQFDEFQSALSKNNTSIARAQTDINTIKTTNLNLQSQVNTLNTQMEAGMNVTIDGAMVKNVNPESNYVNFVTGDNIALSNDNGSLKISAKFDGVVTNGNTGLVSGGMVYNAIQDALAGYGGEAGTVLAGKANADASNIGKNADTDNSSAWGQALGTGTVTQNDDRLVTGKTMYDELRAGDGNYVKSDKTTGQNLQALDTAVGGLQDTVTGIQDTVTGMQDDITGMKGDITDIRSDLDGKADKDLSNLSDSARDVIRTLAQDGIDVTSADSSVGVAKSVADSRTVFDLTVVKNGKVEEGNTGILTGDTVYQAIKDINPYGDNVITGTDSGAVGKRNTVAGNGSYAIGNDNTIAEGSDDIYILGSNVNATGKNSVVLGKGSDGSQDNVVSVGSDGHERKIVHVANGNIAQGSTDAVNGGQLYDVREDLRHANGVDIDDWSRKLGVGNVVEGDTGLVNGGTVYNALQRFTGSDAVTVDREYGALRVGASPKYDELPFVDFSNSQGVPRVLTGIATNIEDPSSAANVGYVNAIGQNIVNGVNEKFTRMDDRIDKVGAGAAAMAGLVPGPMDGDEKWSLSAAVGNYRSATAGAVGAFYKPTENVVLAVKGAFGNGENMVSGGIGVTLNKGNVPGVTKAQLVRTVNAQANEIQTMKAAQAQSLTVINEQAARIERLETALQQVLEAQQKVNE